MYNLHRTTTTMYHYYYVLLLQYNTILLAKNELKQTALNPVYSTKDRIDKGAGEDCMIRKEVMIYFDELTVLLLLLMSFLLLLLIIFIVSIFVASASPIY